MLPSMPFINVNSQDSISEVNSGNNAFPEDLIDKKIVESRPEVLSSSERSETHNSNENQLFPLPSGECSEAQELEFPYVTLPLDGKSCEDELVLLADNYSSADKRKPSSPTHILPKKKKKLDTPTIYKNDSEKNSSYFAEAFFSWAKNVLDKDKFKQFVNTLLEFEVKKWDTVELYQRVCAIFGTNTELKDHFLGFFYPHEALECLFSLEYDLTHRAWTIFSYVEPNQFGKLVSILEQHQAANNPNITVEDLIPSLKSLFRLQPQIVKCLASLFPSGPPPDKSECSYEKVMSLSIDEGDAAYERVWIRHDPIKSCSSIGCQCPCHRRKQKLLCAVCNIRVVNGQIYVKRNKIMRLARVGFVDVSTEEMLKKLNPDLYNNKASFESDKNVYADCKLSDRKMRKSPSESSLNDDKLDSLELSDSEGKSSPSKECRRRHSESDQNMDENDFIKDFYDDQGDFDDDFNQLSSTGSLSDLESLSELEDGSMKSQESLEGLDETKNRMGSPKKRREMTPPMRIEAQDKNTKTEVKILSEENIIEPISGIYKPPHLTAEDDAIENSETVLPVINQSQTEKQQQPQEEAGSSVKSLDILEEPVPSCSAPESIIFQKTWTREEDKVILEAFQKEIGTEHTFSKISSRMPNRSLKDIQTRFQELMRLLEKIAFVEHD